MTNTRLIEAARQMLDAVANGRALLGGDTLFYDWEAATALSLAAVRLDGAIFEAAGVLPTVADPLAPLVAQIKRLGAEMKHGGPLPVEIRHLGRREVV